MTASNPLRPAAAIILTRNNKIWLGHRGQTRFLPGFSVFPGGAGDEDESFPQTALRELKEETGLHLTPDIELLPFARAITPAYSKYRFDVRVYRVELSTREEPIPDGIEFVGGGWYTGEQILRARALGEIQLAPPTYRQVRLWLQCYTGARGWPDRSEAFAEPPPENEQLLPFLPDLTLIPVRTGALPPAAWTNSALIGQGRFLLLDPGGEDMSVVKKEIERRLKGGAIFEGIVLSHHHLDHIVGASQFDVPLYCHPKAKPYLPTSFSTPTLVEDGEEMQLGETLIRFHHTPGHAPGHLAVELPRSKTLLAGDMISSLSSIVIPQDSGDLQHYLDSLKKLQQLQSHLVVPAHGPPFGQGSKPFQEALIHRAKREQQILTILEKGPRTKEQLADSLYPGLNPKLREAALANVSQYLGKLKQESRVLPDGKGWARTVSTGPPLP